MKHLFTVHSHITYLAALGVMTKLNLNVQDCMIFSMCYYANQPIETITRSKRTPLYKIFHPNRQLNIGADIYKIIDQCIGDDTFAVYAPCMVREAAIMAHHPKCVQKNFIEEGLSAYYLGYPFNKLISYFHQDKTSYSLPGRIKESFKLTKLAIRGISAKIMATPLYYNSYANSPGMNFYGFSEEAFPLCEENKYVMNFHDITKRFDINKKLDIDNSWLFFSEYQDPNEDFKSFLLGIENGFIPALKQNNITEINLKFHPSEKQQSRQALQNILKQNDVKYNIIDNQVIMEIEMLSAKNLTVYGFSSSLLVYAAMMGHNANSIIAHVPNYPSIDVPIFNKLVKY